MLQKGYKAEGFVARVNRTVSLPTMNNDSLRGSRLRAFIAATHFPQALTQVQEALVLLLLQVPLWQPMMNLHPLLPLPPIHHPHLLPLLPPPQLLPSKLPLLPRSQSSSTARS